MTLRDRLFVWMQYLWPQHGISRLVNVVTRVRVVWFKNLLIAWFTRHFGVDMSEAAQPEPTAYPDFNSFFTRELKAGARPLASGERDVICPVDGAVSQAGNIDGVKLFQAKGHYFDLDTLLGGSSTRGQPFVGGSFATLYLSPRDYHRIHMPLSGQLREMVHVPGKLFSVNVATTQSVPSLFARNERVVCLFDTDAGPMAVVMVGAINVASIETAWAGVVTPPSGKRVRDWHYAAAEATYFARGDEIGRFNMGSTVIVLFGPGRVNWASAIQPEASVRMGQPLAILRNPV